MKQLRPVKYESSNRDRRQDCLIEWQVTRQVYITLLLLLAFSCCIAPHSECQLLQDSQQVRQSKLDSISSSSTAATWRSHALSSDAQKDEVGADLRKSRNSYWDSHLPPSNGLGSRGAELDAAPELLFNHDSLWVVANFVSYKVYQPDPQGGAYTEIRLQLHQLLANKTGQAVLPESTIDMDIVGGSVKNITGQEKHYNLTFEPYTFIPAHSYLLQLLYVPLGSFYRPERAWDLTTGTAIPVGTAEARSYLNGNAEISGKPASLAVSTAKELLRQNLQSGGAQ